jgi:pantetheine-phosphate adenylyltransferase
MEPVFIYPGTFCPATYGHANIVKRLGKMFAKVFVVCSENPDKKNRLFTTAEAKALWSSYNLPKNVVIDTLEEFLARKFNPKRLVMIRGIRDEKDFDYEKKVFFHNKNSFGIDKYIFIPSEKKYHNISSSLAREKAAKGDLLGLSRLVSPLVASALLEKTFGFENLFLVVGRPGGGKSTFLKKMTELDSNNIHINTDEFNHALRPLLAKLFGDEDLMSVALKNEAKLMKAIKTPWLKMLGESLIMAKGKKNIFIEAAYGLKADKSIFRFIGGKVIYIGCNSETENLARMNGRGTPHLSPFLLTIPGYEESVKIAEEKKLLLAKVETDGSMEELSVRAKELNKAIKEGTVYGGSIL